MVERRSRSPMVAPETGARRPGKEKRKRFLRCDLRMMSQPWCLRTCLEGLREERHREGESERSLLSRARDFNLFLCLDSGSSLSPPFFDDEARTITATATATAKAYRVSSSSSSSSKSRFWPPTPSIRSDNSNRNDSKLQVLVRIRSYTINLLLIFLLVWIQVLSEHCRIPIYFKNSTY